MEGKSATQNAQIQRFLKPYLPFDYVLRLSVSENDGSDRDFYNQQIAAKLL